MREGRLPHEAVKTEALRQTVLQEILRAYLDALLPEPPAGGFQDGNNELYAKAI